MNRMALFIIVLGLLVAAVAAPGQFKPEKYGIGATLVGSDTTSFVAVRSCMPGGPAHRAGLLPGDLIVELDGKSVKGWSFSEVLSYLVKEEQLPVRITVLRGPESISYELVRARFSDIFAGAGFKIVAGRDSLGYTFAPLHEADSLGLDATVLPVTLQGPQCRDQKLEPRPENRTLLYFWATWCGPCKMLAKELNIKQEEISRSGIRLVGINVDSSCGMFQAVVDTLECPGEQYWAGGMYGELAQSLRVYRRGIPTGALIDEDGKLLSISTGVWEVLGMIDSTSSSGKKQEPQKSR